MYYIVKGHNEIDTVQSAIQIFYPNSSFHKTKTIPDDGLLVMSCVFDNTILAKIYKDGKEIDSFSLLIQEKNVNKRDIKYSIFALLKMQINLKTPWGIMTGVRPAKLVEKLALSGMNKEEIVNYMKDSQLAENSKIELAIKTYEKEKIITHKNTGKDVSLYIGIPFCPTRCLYCSFTSFKIEKYKNYVDKYLDSLFKEMEYGKKFLKNKFLESIYVGGGTPTSLNPKQLELLLNKITNYFDIANAKEFTLEAGRPDTITKEKLHILKNSNISRISINPQTLNNKTLKLIGRNHTKEDFVNAFNMARSMGFNNINVDIILGLPGENLSDVKYTLNEIKKLQPENLTVHTLAIKRASKLREELSAHNLSEIDLIEEMINLSAYYAKELGLSPYYMYRQKNSLGNFENVGYSKEGLECIYNVQIMAEKQSILALGAGASTKFINLESNRIERAFNVKDVCEYINRIDEMIDRKYILKKMM